MDYLISILWFFTWPVAVIIAYHFVIYNLKGFDKNFKRYE